MTPASFSYTPNRHEPGDAYPVNGAADFAVSDYEGKNLGAPNRRMQYVLCPFGTGRTVAKIWVEAGDDSDTWGGCRAEQMPATRDVVAGDETWVAFANAVGPEFRSPTGNWNVVGVQQHLGLGSPQVATEILPDGSWGIAIREPVALGSAAKRYSMGHKTRGAYVFHVYHNKWSAGASGLFEYWYGIGQAPDLSAPPAHRCAGPNILPPGTPPVGLVQTPNLTTYRDPSGGNFPTAQYVWGVGRGPSAAIAMGLADFPGAVVPDVPTAERELRYTLDWFHAPKPSGMGYVVERTRQTHAYRALRALGGSWP